MGWEGGGGGGHSVCGSGVRPEDSDNILRPVWGDWDQDCKTKTLPLLLRHLDRATGL